MIYDKIENINKYKGFSKWFNYAADFLMNTILNALPLGRTEIDRDHVFINVMEVDTVNEDKVFFEIHKKYLDIQLDIKGTEKVHIGLGKRAVVSEFKEDIDFGTVSCEKYMDCVIEEGYFIICMDGEPHKPTLCNGESAMIKKCVIKVEVEGYE